MWTWGECAVGEYQVSLRHCLAGTQIVTGRCVMPTMTGRAYALKRLTEQSHSGRVGSKVGPAGCPHHVQRNRLQLVVLGGEQRPTTFDLPWLNDTQLLHANGLKVESAGYQSLLPYLLLGHVQGDGSPEESFHYGHAYLHDVVHAGDINALTHTCGWITFNMTWWQSTDHWSRVVLDRSGAAASCILSGLFSCRCSWC